MPLRVQIVTAEREVWSEDAVDMVVAPGSEGVVGILPRHAPLMTTLQPGIIRIKKGESEEALAVGGGFLQVARDRVLILADTAERADEIDRAQAEEARQRAQEAVSEHVKQGQRTQAESARVALRRSLVRIQVAQHHQARRRPGPSGDQQQ
jgi:F-type H+-transporting ATPase subunit epsilon